MPGKRDSLPEKSLRFSKVTDAGLKELAGLTTATSNGVQVMGANCSKGTSAARVGRLDRRAQVNLRNLFRSDIHEEASVKTKEQDDHGTSQTSIRHHPRLRSAMREYAVAPIHTGGVALRPVGPRDAT